MRTVWKITTIFALNLICAPAPKAGYMPIPRMPTPSVVVRQAAALPQGETADDALLAGAEARIDKIRKADLTVLVVDRKGRPLPNAQVKIEQVRHDFLFGCAALSLLSHPEASREETYQQRFGALFNFATVLTYWHDTEPEQGK